VQQPLAQTASGDTATAVEAERRRLAELLQRSVIESLNLLLAQANVYEQVLSVNSEARMVVSVLGSLARQALQQARDLEANLHPSVLEALGLEAALEVLASQATRAHGLQVALELSRLRERLPVPVELALFRVAQDTLDRAVYHAHASHVRISLERRDDLLMLDLSDNGSAAAGTETLRAACQRAEQLGGSVETTIGARGGLKLTICIAVETPPQLTPREMDVLGLLTEGLSNKEIGQRLSLSPRTVNFHLDHIYSKLGVTTRTEAAVYALRHGWSRSQKTQPG
jgi:DNA-binding CsgD family transcriptional regulator